MVRWLSGEGGKWPRGHVGRLGARVRPYIEPRRMTPPHARAPSCSSSSSMAPPPPPHKSLERTPPQQPAVLAAESAAERFADERCMAAKSGWVPPLSPPLRPPCGGEVLHMLMTRPREPTARGDSLGSTGLRRGVTLTRVDEPHPALLLPGTWRPLRPCTRGTTRGTTCEGDRASFSPSPTQSSSPPSPLSHCPSSAVTTTGTVPAPCPLAPGPPLRAAAAAGLPSKAAPATGGGRWWPGRGGC